MGPWQGQVADKCLFPPCPTPPHPPPAASIFSRWEVEEDWCLSVLRSYQAERGPDFPWSVGKEGLGQDRVLGRGRGAGAQYPDVQPMCEHPSLQGKT